MAQIMKVNLIQLIEKKVKKRDKAPEITEQYWDKVEKLLEEGAEKSKQNIIDQTATAEQMKNGN